MDDGGKGTHTYSCIHAFLTSQLRVAAEVTDGIARGHELHYSMTALRHAMQLAELAHVARHLQLCASTHPLDVVTRQEAVRDIGDLVGPAQRIDITQDKPNPAPDTVS